MKSTVPTSITNDETTLRTAHEVLSGQSKKTGFARLLPFLGPAFIACVAYIDPGNFATNIQGGAKFGYQLLWVIVASNLMAKGIRGLAELVPGGTFLFDVAEEVVKRLRERKQMR